MSPKANQVVAKIRECIEAQAYGLTEAEQEAVFRTVQFDMEVRLDDRVEFEDEDEDPEFAPDDEDESR